MKIEIENKTNETIDWSKPQILMSNDKNTIVLSNGNHNNLEFEGYTIAYGYWITPIFSKAWAKDSFEPYKGVLKLSNE